jgi:leucyl-tRNA synthetase
MEHRHERGGVTAIILSIYNSTKWVDISYLSSMWYGTERARWLRKNQTESEKKLWQELRNRKLAGLKFYRQHVIRYNEGIFIADFYCHEKKLVIEVDGKIHLKKKEEDSIRDDIVKEMGMKVLRFKNEELDDINKVLQIISEHVV